MTDDKDLRDAASKIEEKKAAWWAWPLVFVSLAVVLISSLLLDQSTSEVDEISPSEPRPDWSKLALFEWQGKMIVTASTVSETQATLTLRQLEGHASDPHSRIALALLYSFIEGEEGKNANRLLLEVERAKDMSERAQRALLAGVDSGEREVWKKQLGWFARLFPEKGPAGEVLDTPFAKSLISESKSATYRAFFFLFVLGAAFLVGLFVFSWLFFRLQKAEQRAFDPQHLPAGVLMESFALYLGIMVFGGLVTSLLFPTWLVFLHYLLSFVVAICWPLFRGFRWREICRSIGWTRGRGILREIGAGILGYCSVLPIAAVGIAITLVLSFSLGRLAVPQDIESDGSENVEASEQVIEPETHPIVGMLAQADTFQKLLLFLLAAIVAPVLEETFFRGALHRHMRRRFRFLPSALVGGAIFAALHPQGWLAIPALTAIALGFAILREWRDSLIAPMVAHGINNGLIVGLMVSAL